MQLHQIRMGDHGPKVAFLHGVFGQGRNWSSIGKALSDNHRVYLIDLPNHGHSPWTEDIDYFLMADQVADFLAGYGPVNLVGHSMGGKTAMMVAQRHSDLVRRLCVADVSPVDYGGHRSFNTYIDAMQSIDLATLRDRQEADEQLGELIPDTKIRTFLMQNLRRTRHRDPALRRGDNTPRWHWQMNLDLIAKRMDTISGWPADLEVRPFEKRTLWIAGADSNYVKPGYGDTMRELFPLVRQLTIKNSGHWVHTDQPQVFVAAVRRFVNRPDS